jgi:hypothetical protein
MVVGLPGHRRPRSRSWSGFAVAVAAALATIALLAIALSHKQSQFPTATECPSATVANRALGTDVAAPTAVSESDLLGCSYRQGSDAQAVAVSFAIYERRDDPCRVRRRFVLSGDEACDVTGTSGAAGAVASLVVETTTRQDQFSTDLRGPGLLRLEALAVKVLASTPPSLHDDVTSETS